MCELLVWAYPRRNTGNFAVDCHAPNTGDVVTNLTDGSHWGDGPMGVIAPGDPNGNHPFFRILKLANISMVEAANLMSPEMETDPKRPNPFLQYRQFYIDFDKITDTDLLAYLNDNSRAEPFIVLDYGVDWLDSVTSKRERLVRPA